MVHWNILLFDFLLNGPTMDFSALKTYLDCNCISHGHLSAHYESVLMIHLSYIAASSKNVNTYHLYSFKIS